jgi:hypothetical protein
MKRSIQYLDVAKAALRVVRPELSDDEVERAAHVIAANRRPHAKTVDMNHVRKVRDEVSRAIARGDGPPAPSIG